MSTDADLIDKPISEQIHASEKLAASITRSASKQCYYIVRLLADRDRLADANRAYAYFRWVDDRLDDLGIEREEALAILSRQQTLLNNGYQGRWPDDLCAEEQMLAHLVQGESESQSGLATYLHCMMEVMAFDAHRRGEFVSQHELEEYSYLLAKAVTEALHHFIGHGMNAPRDERRYLAATGAHVAHMLRDSVEDTAMGYYNVPVEMLQANQIGPLDMASEPYRAWVRQRVALARRQFAAGESYLAEVESLRCRLAGYLYMARFEPVLGAIERDGYVLRAAYPDCKNAKTALGMGWSMLTRNLTRERRPAKLSGPHDQPATDTAG